MRGDVSDIVAVILGVWFTIRKLDAQKRLPEDFPHVPRDAFLAWQAQEVRVYQIATWACFFKVMVNVGFLFFVAPSLPWPVVRVVGASIFFAWATAIGWSFYRGSRLKRLRRRLGIILGGFVVEERREPDDTEPQSEHEESDPSRD